MGLAAAAKSLQSCPTLRPHRRQPIRLHRPWDSPGKNTGVGCHCLLQCVKSLSPVRLLVTPWTAAHQAPPSMGFSRQEYSSGVPLPSPKENCESEKVKLLSRVLFFVIPWTIAYQASLSMGLSRQEYWSGLPFPSSGDLPDPGIKPRSPALQADALPSEPPGKPQSFSPKATYNWRTH